MLETAATLEFVDLPASLAAGQKATIKMKVTNVGAGHKLPTGFPEGREVWVDFKVRDADGNEIYRLGKIEHGHTEPGTRSFKATLGDPQGNVVTFKVWEADRVLSDTRLLPKGWAVVDFTFPVPPGVRGPLQFDVDLNYASFPQAVLDELLGPGTLEGRIVKMTHSAHSMPVVATGTVGAAAMPQGSEQKGER